MCRSIDEGGRRCRCTTAEQAEKKRAQRNEAQKRYLARKASVVEVENPFTNFIPETITLTAEQRAEEKSRLADFFARKRADPDARWDAAPNTVEQRDTEAGFHALMDELRGVTPT
ncbi:Uncharacterised protein [Mycobacteroides abscessus subsp. abscessus]|uniref:hypothetical protein n=1 Tax=Mycobacteroides abscessus TaxID=36809 RepID=UPI00092AE5DF|nr:hypothetical protein [Mycobacteroides abscessus]MDM2173426.1 hypothetical protein [Mycobacteroides abscessus]MDM2176303.1 hypothetical protein [Mycobacteroides abscessus]MDM2204868.1 hypothetical protein [Mycobacteroides abscessus]MDM2213856.1 hypothetical protein [Mycobacteroides abscessus]MDM2215787.1 hypothetical protein [Mycobacteroides abscessus]